MPIICYGCRYQPICNYIYDGKCVKTYYERYAERLAAQKQKIVINMPEIRKVIFNYPATVVLWSDGTKTVVKCGGYDIYDPEKGLAMAIAKKALGNQGNYYDEFKKWLPEERPIEEDTTEAFNRLRDILNTASKNKTEEPDYVSIVREQFDAVCEKYGLSYHYDRLMDEYVFIANPRESEYANVPDKAKDEICKIVDSPIAKVADMRARFI